MAPRSIWKGAISFGLVTIPVKLFTATEEKDISFRQVHPADGGRIKYKRVCEVCEQEIPYGEIAKGYELPDGRMVILESEDFENLPLPTTRSVEVVQFVPGDQVDPTYFDKTYFLSADGPGAKPYVLLRDALLSTGQCALVKVAIRQREALALIRPVDGVLRMHTMLWPDEVRDSEFAAPPTDVTVSDAEVAMATSFIDALAGEFQPESHSDAYRRALEERIEAKLSGLPEAEPDADDDSPGEAEVVDLVAALRASVEAAKQRRAGARSTAPAESDADEETSGGSGSGKTVKKSAAKKTAAKKTAAKKSTAKKSATKKSTAKKTTSRKSAERKAS